MILVLFFPLLAIANASTRPATAPDFPASWEGTWKGPCRYLSVNGPSREFGMELRIWATDDPKRFIWEITYEMDGKRQVRPYELLVVDADAGRYAVDEKNSIVLDAYLVGGDTLMSHFTVNDAMLTASYRVEGDTMRVEITNVDAKIATETGGKEGAPKVTTNAVRGVQRALLERRP
jgi:hypothetical protein